MPKQILFNSIDISSRWNESKSNGCTHVEVFAGCGGLSLGFKMAGYEEIAALEFEPHAVETFRKNFDHPLIAGDITVPETKQRLYDVVKERLKGRELDVLSGGFPCQSFSTSGKRMKDDVRSKLFKDLVEVAKVLKPKVVVGENVVGLLTMDGGRVVRDILAAFHEIGYQMEMQVLCAADYYVPQTRHRVIFVGNRIGTNNAFPIPLVSSQHYVTASQAIGDLEFHPEDTSFSHVFTKHNAGLVKKLEVLAEGDHLYPTRNDAWERLRWDKPSPTIKDCHGACAVHYKQSRTITPREMARLQSFPDDFLFVGPKKYQQQQIGNAVPPLLGKAVALAVLKVLEH